MIGPNPSLFFEIKKSIHSGCTQFGTAGSSYRRKVLEELVSTPQVGMREVTLVMVKHGDFPGFSYGFSGKYQKLMVNVAWFDWFDWCKMVQACE